MKSIFKLEKKEWKKLEKEFRKSYHYKQYLIEFMVGLIIFSFICGFCLSRIISVDYLQNSIKEIYFYIGIMIFFGIITILSVIFAIKKLDLLKKYYKEQGVK